MNFKGIDNNKKMSRNDYSRELGVAFSTLDLIQQNFERKIFDMKIKLIGKINWEI